MNDLQLSKQKIAGAMNHVDRRRSQSANKLVYVLNTQHHRRSGIAGLDESPSTLSIITERTLFPFLAGPVRDLFNVGGVIIVSSSISLSLRFAGNASGVGDRDGVSNGVTDLRRSSPEAGD